jgi:hypothetical protein
VISAAVSNTDDFGRLSVDSEIKMN